MWIIFSHAIGRILTLLLALTDLKVTAVPNNAKSYVAVISFKVIDLMMLFPNSIVNR